MQEFDAFLEEVKRQLVLCRLKREWSELTPRQHARLGELLPPLLEADQHAGGARSLVDLGFSDDTWQAVCLAAVKARYGIKLEPDQLLAMQAHYGLYCPRPSPRPEADVDDPETDERREADRDTIGRWLGIEASDEQVAQFQRLTGRQVTPPRTDEPYEDLLSPADLWAAALRNDEERVRLYLEAKREGLSDQAIAERFGVNRKTIQRLKPKVRQLAKATLKEVSGEAILVEQFDEIETDLQDLNRLQRQAVADKDAKTAIALIRAKGTVRTRQVGELRRLGAFKGVEVRNPADERRAKEVAALWAQAHRAALAERGPQPPT